MTFYTVLRYGTVQVVIFFLRRYYGTLLRRVPVPLHCTVATVLLARYFYFYFLVIQLISLI